LTRERNSRHILERTSRICPRERKGRRGGGRPGYFWGKNESIDDSWNNKKKRELLYFQCGKKKKKKLLTERERKENFYSSRKDIKLYALFEGKGAVVQHRWRGKKRKKEEKRKALVYFLGVVQR